MHVLVYDENNIITQIFGTSDIQHIEHLLKEKKYKAFENSSAHIGMNINAVLENGQVMRLSEQVQKGYYKLPEDCKLDGEQIVMLSEDELKEKFPERYPVEPEPTELELAQTELNTILYEKANELFLAQAHEQLLVEAEASSPKARSLSRGQVYKNLLDKIESLKNEK